MENEYSLSESVQAQTGEFKYLYVDGEEVELDSILSRLDALENPEPEPTPEPTPEPGPTQFDPTYLEDRLKALEDAFTDTSIVDDLSTNVQALQTRIGTLESLVGLLTNDNTNDTDIEHRISRLEKAVTALKAIHDAKKSVYNIPLDW